MNALGPAHKNPGNSGYPLITRERTQKLDLLKHLIDNLANTIVVCGPEGIGKTKLLKAFQQSTEQSCVVCWLQSDNKLDFAEVSKVVLTTIGEYFLDLQSRPLQVALDHLLSRGAKVVLVVDDAGELAPGVIEKIISYSTANPALRVVLALTHGELYLKNTTDPALEDCYLIEIPSLTKQQCEDYLDFLSTLPTPRIDFSQINDEKVAQIFRESHGVPGKILTALPKPLIRKNVDYSKSILMVAVTGLVLVALGVQWWSANHPVTDAGKTQANQQAAANSTNAQSTANTVVNLAANQPQSNNHPAEMAAIDHVGNPSSQTLGQAPAGEAHTAMQSNAELQLPVSVNQQNPVASQVVEKTQNVEVNNSKLPETSQISIQTNPESGGNVGEGGHWLAAQPSVNYTLQLMALSSEQVILQVLQRYPELSDELRYIKTKTRRGKDRFILFYGSFSDPELIKIEKTKLPKELQKIWVRQIADLQREMNATEQVQLTTD